LYQLQKVHLTQPAAGLPGSTLPAAALAFLVAVTHAEENRLKKPILLLDYHFFIRQRQQLGGKAVWSSAGPCLFSC